MEHDPSRSATNGSGRRIPARPSTQLRQPPPRKADPRPLKSCFNCHLPYPFYGDTPAGRARHYYEATIQIDRRHIDGTDLKTMVVMQRAWRRCRRDEA